MSPVPVRAGACTQTATVFFWISRPDQWLRSVEATRVREGIALDYPVRLKRLVPLIGTYLTASDSGH